MWYRIERIKSSPYYRRICFTGEKYGYNKYILLPCGYSDICKKFRASREKTWTSASCGNGHRGRHHRAFKQVPQGRQRYFKHDFHEADEPGKRNFKRVQSGGRGAYSFFERTRNQPRRP